MALPVANLVLAALLTGLIWTIQVVCYPLFALVGEGDWERYELAHTRRITPLVLPPMLANVALAAVLAVDGGRPLGLRLANVALAAGIFAATGLLYGPMHGAMAQRRAPGQVARLVDLNWLRTLAWTAQLGVAIALL